jgi:molybdate transport system regulatory protein
MPKLRHPDRHGLHLRIVLRGGATLGPGRAELLEGIRTHGSIAAAGRAMGMSYRRAWLLVEETSSEFGAPMVAARPGGIAGGGAALTELGEAALALYRRAEAHAAAAVTDELAALEALVRAKDI